VGPTVETGPAVETGIVAAVEPAVRRLASGSPWEPAIGYSRAVVAGPLVFVAGTTGTVDGRVVGEGDPYAQTVQAFRNVEAAMASAGAGLADVVQTRMFVTDIARWRSSAGPTARSSARSSR
jgi:enamine deaminase RidA (YjgF/YER057c/UK114 family)